MEVSYSVSIGVSVEGVKPEDLESVVALADDYWLRLKRVSRDHEYDYDGWPTQDLGTYSVDFELGVCGISSLDDMHCHVDMGFENWKRIEKKLNTKIVD